VNRTAFVLAGGGSLGAVQVGMLKALVVLPPLCPLTTNAYDFSHTRELIHRAEAATRLWLTKNGLHGRGAPPELQLHHHHD